MRNKGFVFCLRLVLGLLGAISACNATMAENQLQNIYDATKDFSENASNIFQQLKSEDANIEYLWSQINRFEQASKPHYLLQLSKCLLVNNQIDSIPSILDNCIPGFETQDCTLGIAYCYFYKGEVSSRQYHPEEVITFFEKANMLFIKEANYNRAFLATMYIAIYFTQNGNYPYAKNYFSKTEAIANQYPINELYCEMLKLNFANYYFKICDYVSALHYYKKIEEARLQQGDELKLARIKNNMAMAYLNIDRLDSAETKLTEALRLREKNNDSIGVASSLMNLFNLNLRRKDASKAISVEKRIQKLILQNPHVATDYLLSLSYNRLRLFHLTNQSELADEELDVYKDLKDSLNEVAFSDKLIDLQKSIEIEDRDQNIALLQKEEALNKAVVAKQRQLIIFGVSLIVMLIVLGYLMNRQRLNLISSESNLQKHKNKIEQINEELKVSNQAKDRILSIIGHDLRGPIGSLKELTELYKGLNDFDKQDFQNLLEAASAASNGSYFLLENLLTWANSQKGQIEFNPSQCLVLPLAIQCVQVSQAQKNTFKYNIPDDLIITADVNMLSTILRNLISNAVKFSPDNSCITISAKQNELETQVCVEDEGTGMGAEQAIRLFEKKETFFIQDKAGVKGTGLGLILCKEFVEQHKGSIAASSSLNKGTKVWFTIPCNIISDKETEPTQVVASAIN
nr:ATP-binding protein [uncultured Carboxylicivirga sp.]